MAEAPRVHDTRPESKARLLNAAVDLIRLKGYAATRVEDICERARLSKGSFFHYFKSKEDLAVAAADYWGELSTALFGYAPYRALPDPLARILAYLDFRKTLLKGDPPNFTCLAGTMLQETYATHPEIRDACGQTIYDHAAALESDIAEAMRERGIQADWTAKSLALHTQAVLQGAFILAKAQGNSGIVVESIDHLRRYIELLFQTDGQRNRKGVHA